MLSTETRGIIIAFIASLSFAGTTVAPAVSQAISGHSAGPSLLHGGFVAPGQ